MQEIALAVFGAIVVLFLLLGAGIDMAARIEYAQDAFPALKNLAEKKKWRTIVLFATCLFYGGTLYELLKQPEAVVPTKFLAPVGPSVAVQKVLIKTTGSGRLDRDMNNQQSNHLYEQLKQIAENKNAPGLANITIVHPYPQDRESMHLFLRLNRVFTDAHWKVTQYQGWPLPALSDKGNTEIPIGMWVMTDNQYLRYTIWSNLQQAGLESQERTEYLPSDFKGAILVIGYKDVPF